FPMIVFKVFEKQKHTPYSEIINYGIRRSDLGYFGALKTRSITDLKNDTKENDLIIVAGGEVLGGGWMNILRFFSPFWNKIYHNRLLRGVINRLQLLDTWKYLTVGSSKPF